MVLCCVLIVLACVVVIPTVVLIVVIEHLEGMAPAPAFRDGVKASRRPCLETSRTSLESRH
jgi:hypothetical protein